MWTALNELFGKRKRDAVSKADKDAARLMEDFYTYYEHFQKKLKLFMQLKEILLGVKAQIYNYKTKQYQQVNLNETAQLQQQVNTAVAALKEELREIKRLIKEEVIVEKEEVKYTTDLRAFLDQELAKEEEYRTALFWPKYKEQLLGLKAFLEGSKQQMYGAFHLLASQLQLLRDIENAEEEIEADVKQFRNKEEKAQEKLQRTLSLLEAEIMRFGKYCQEEANMIHAPGVWLKKFKSDYSTLRALGLMYSEKWLTPYNIGLITTRIGQNTYGTKGIGIIRDDQVEVRFVKGAAERHAELVQMLFEGTPGVRLREELAIREYLHGLPIEKITKIAGYELQLTFIEDQLQIVNINYSSTILEVLIERKTIQGQFLSISKKDFDRLNYALLYSIDKRLLDNKLFRMNLEKHGNKIHIIDQRIYPFVGGA